MPNIVTRFRLWFKNVNCTSTCCNIDINETVINNRKLTSTASSVSALTVNEKKQLLNKHS